MESSTMLLSSGIGQSLCRIHPVVIFSILDHYIRRNDGQDRVIGTLLGVPNDGSGILEIRNCFPVPHIEGDQVAVDMDFHRNMFALHKKTAPNEVIVGWYATGIDINENSVIIHDFYGKEMGSSSSPIHLLVDSGLTNDTMGIKAFIGTSLSFSEKTLGSFFQPIPLEFTTLEADNIGLDVLSRAKGTISNNNAPAGATLQSDLDTLEASIQKLLELLNRVSDYVEAVVAGKIDGDNQIGRFLTKSLALLPKSEMEMMERVFHGSIQDLLMVVYLGNLTRIQLTLAEKLQQTLP
eukprot:TRINITY_DN155_c0_g1_i10.p1 TRINITY_DN155_c0_g1~~TRINITY_DN155_c0_g1_i10.p1  ORF type:complete len:294 (+),score=71.66 TRINITY_DN155_c0_g1_i10:155-1036(+)